MAQGLQAPGHKDPVFPLKGHDVRHGAQADHVGVLLQHGLLVAAEGAGQFEGYAHAGEVFVGVPPINTMGIHHRGGLGQGVLALVVVGDDQVDAQLPAQLRFRQGGDAAVHGDHQFHTFAAQLANGDGV